MSATTVNLPKSKVNKVEILAEGLCEDVELDPATVWQVRVYGRGVYQPAVKQLNDAVRVLSICFYR